MKYFDFYVSDNEFNIIMEINRIIDLLKEEYFHLQNTIETFDQKALNIKGWSITVSMSGIGVAFTTSYTKEILLLSAGASVLFWLIETLWKVFQNSYYERVREIELIFKDEAFDIPSAKLSIYRSWDSEYNKTKFSKKFFKMLFWSHVCLPHIVIVVIGIVLFILK